MRKRLVKVVWIAAAVPEARHLRTGMIGRYLTQYEQADYPEYIPPGWDRWFGLWTSGDQYYRYKVNDDGTARYFGTSPDEYSTRVLTDEVLAFLEQEPGRPFFLLLTPARHTSRRQRTFST